MHQQAPKITASNPRCRGAGQMRLPAIALFRRAESHAESFPVLRLDPGLGWPPALPRGRKEHLLQPTEQSRKQLRGCDNSISAENGTEPGNTGIRLWPNGVCVIISRSARDRFIQSLIVRLMYRYPVMRAATHVAYRFAPGSPRNAPILVSFRRFHT
jgi:hypothetical protein